MEKSSRFAKVLTYQSVGFLVIIALFVLHDLVGLPALIFQGYPRISDLRDPALQMLLILAVWLLVNASTRRMLERMRNLERFLRVCAWCRRIDYQGNWMRLEDFMEQGFDTPTTHGICRDCLEQQQTALRLAKRERQQPKKAA